MLFDITDCTSYRQFNEKVLALPQRVREDIRGWHCTREFLMMYYEQWTTPFTRATDAKGQPLLHGVPIVSVV